MFTSNIHVLLRILYVMFCCFVSACHAQPTATTTPTLQANQNMLKNRLEQVSKEIKQKNTSSLYLKRAYMLDSLHNYLDALTDVNAFLRQEPKHVAAYELRGFLKLKLNDASGAVNDFNRILLLDPKHAEAYYQRGLIRLHVRDTSGACKEFVVAKEYKHPKAAESLQKYCKKFP